MQKTEELEARSDLACEGNAVHERVEGATWSERQVGDMTVFHLRIEQEAAAKRLQKPCGSYVTVSCGRMERLTGEQAELLIRLLAGELVGMCERSCGKRSGASLSVLVAGLGNAELTADAIGPKTAGALTATRHLRRHEAELFQNVGCAELSVLLPGVSGQTGIEALELLRGAVAAVKPDIVLVVDALAARSCERLASTVQLSDVGIVPGSGVGNHRAAIDRSTLGVPVLALGVPTVVNSATLVRDALREADIWELSPAVEEVLQTGRSFFVSPRECDVICERASALLADSIELAFGGRFGER